MAKDWLKQYGSTTPQKFQQGGPMGAPQGAPQEGAAPAGASAQEGPNIDAMLQEYAQSRDPQLAVAICDMIIEMMASQGGGAGAPAPAGGAPMARRGAKMTFKA